MVVSLPSTKNISLILNSDLYFKMIISPGGIMLLLLFVFQNRAYIYFSLSFYLNRYSGCCAWRGVLEFSNVENSKTITGIIKVYPDLEKCLYFDLASSTHTVLYELQNKKPEPKVKVTFFLSSYTYEIPLIYNNPEMNFSVIFLLKTYS